MHATSGTGQLCAVKLAPGGVLIGNNGVCLARNTILDSISIAVANIAWHLLQFAGRYTSTTVLWTSSNLKDSNWQLMLKFESIVL